MRQQILLNLKAHRVTKHEGRLALKFMYHILINYGTHSHLSDPSKIGTHIHVSHFFATLGDKVPNNCVFSFTGAPHFCNSFTNTFSTHTLLTKGTKNQFKVKCGY